MTKLERQDLPLVKPSRLSHITSLSFICLNIASRRISFIIFPSTWEKLTCDGTNRQGLNIMPFQQMTRLPSNFLTLKAQFHSDRRIVFISSCKTLPACHQSHIVKNTPNQKQRKRYWHALHYHLKKKKNNSQYDFSLFCFKSRVHGTRLTYNADIPSIILTIHYTATSTQTLQDGRDT